MDLDADPPRIILAGLPGVPLSKQLDGKLPLPPLEAIAVTLEAASVLAAAHRFGLGHGRMGPATVCIGAGKVQIDFTGTATREDDSPGPAANAEALTSDLEGVAGLLVWLNGGRKPQPGETLPTAVPAPVRVLAGDVLNCPVEERPSIGEFVDRLRYLIVVLQSQAGMDATNPENFLATAPPPQRAVRERLGRFRLIEKIGQGGMGEVFAPRTPATAPSSPSKHCYRSGQATPTRFAGFARKRACSPK